MLPTISSFADTSSVLNRGRAEADAYADTAAMKDDSWRTRLKEAVEASDASMRAVSLASGNGPGYVHSILSEGKEPTIGNLLDVCQALNVSPIYILFGMKVTPEDEAILEVLRDNPSSRDSILNLLRTVRQG